MIDHRYDPFQGLAKPVLKTERIKIPEVAPFYVKLREFPLETTPPTLLLRDADSATTENPDQDCSVSQQTGLNQNEAFFQVGRMNTLAGGHMFRAFMRFDVSSLPASPSKVLLRIYLANILGESTTQNIGVYRVTSSWTESSPTWAAQPTFDTSPLGSFAIVPPDDGVKRAPHEGYGGWYETDVTTLYNMWKAGPNYGLTLRPDDTIYALCTFNSREALYKPQLVVVEGGASYLQVGQQIKPTDKEFAVAYSHAMLSFHSSLAGLELDLDYLAMGSPVDSGDVGLRGVTSGTASAYTLTSEYGRILLVPFSLIYFQPHVTCNAAATINPDDWGAIPLYKDGAPIGASSLVLGRIYSALFDGTNFQVQ